MHKKCTIALVVAYYLLSTTCTAPFTTTNKPATTTTTQQPNINHPTHKPPPRAYENTELRRRRRTGEPSGWCISCAGFYWCSHDVCSSTKRRLRLLPEWFWFDDDGFGVRYDVAVHAYVAHSNPLVYSSIQGSVVQRSAGPSVCVLNIGGGKSRLVYHFVNGKTPSGVAQTTSTNEVARELTLNAFTRWRIFGVVWPSGGEGVLAHSSSSS